MAKSSKLSIQAVLEFLTLEKPVSSNAKPLCIKKINIVPNRTHMVSIAEISIVFYLQTKLCNAFLFIHMYKTYVVAKNKTITLR